MAKTNPVQKLLRGRPPLYHVRRCIGFGEADYAALIKLGDGSITSGIRRALSLLRARGIVK
jgi:hypothetical protein